MTWQENLRMEWFTKWRSSRYVLRSSRIINPMMNRGRPKKRRSLHQKLKLYGVKMQSFCFQAFSFLNFRNLKNASRDKASNYNWPDMCTVLNRMFHSVWKSHKKVSFNIASEASYIYILSGQKFIKNAKDGPFWRVFENATFWAIFKHCDVTCFRFTVENCW